MGVVVDSRTAIFGAGRLQAAIMPYKKDNPLRIDFDNALHIDPDPQVVPDVSNTTDEYIKPRLEEDYDDESVKLSIIYLDVYHVRKQGTDHVIHNQFDDMRRALWYLKLGGKLIIAHSSHDILTNAQEKFDGLRDEYSHIPIIIDNEKNRIASLKELVSKQEKTVQNEMDFLKDTQGLDFKLSKIKFQLRENGPIYTHLVITRTR
jgi:hypothetical protein